MDAVPTPYDITPIPVFAFSPGLSVWLTLIGAAFLVLIILKFYERRLKSRRSKESAAIERALAELVALQNSKITAPKNTISAALRIVRLALSVSEPPFEGLLATEMSGRELRKWQQNSRAELQQVLERVIAIDSEIYSDQSSSENSARQQVKELLTIMQCYSAACNQSANNQRGAA